MILHGPATLRLRSSIDPVLYAGERDLDG